MPSSRSDAEIVTPTGWRIVGRGAEELAASTARTAERARPRLEAGDPSTLGWALTCTLEPRTPGVNAVDRVLEALAEDLREAWPDAPIPRRDEGFDHPPSRFGGASWRVAPAPGKAWKGEAYYRTAHPRVAGAPLTTRVLLEETRSFTRLSVQRWADDGFASIRADVGTGQLTPAFLEPLHQTLRIIWMGRPLGPRALPVGDEGEFIRGVLELPTRPLPVVLLTPREDGSYVVDPEAFARELLGRAHLWVMAEHRQTFRITDGLGDRRLSAFFGAARAYYPGFSRHDDPMEHTLLVADRLSDPLMRAAFLGELGRRVAPEQRVPEGIPPVDATSAEPTRKGPAPTDSERVRPPAGAPATAASAPPADTVGGPPSAGGSAAAAEPRPSASPHGEPLAEPTLRALLRQGEATRAALQGIRETLADLGGEVERLATVAGLRNASTAHIERRLQRIEEVLERSFPDPDPGADTGVTVSGPDGRREEEAGAGDAPESLPDSLEGVVQGAAERHADALLVLSSAIEAARESPYEDPERVREILRAMAAVSRRRQQGTLGSSLKEAFETFGVDYRGGIAPSTSERLRRQYLFHLPDGEGVECFEHIALGGTYSPRRCLRIYFSSKLVTDSRFVIGHVGRHFEVMTSS